MRYLINLTFILSTTLQAGSIHKWVDADGNTHHGDSPPAATKSESVSVQALPSNPGKALPRLSTQTTGAEDESNTPTSSSESSDEVPADQAKIACDNAREDLKVIKGSNRIKLRAADGTTRYMSSEEIASRKEQSSADIDRFCK